MLPFPMGGKRETGRCHAGNGWVPCRPNGEGGYHAACNAECGCPAAQDGKVLRCQERKVPRCREEVLRCPERGSCRSHPGKQLRNRYCQIAVLPSLLFAKSACRIDRPAGLLNLLYCRVGRIVKPAVLPNLQDCQNCRLLSLLYYTVCRKHGVPAFLPV